MSCLVLGAICSSVSNLFNPWLLQWTTAGVILGIGAQWESIYRSYFDVDKSPVQNMTGIIIFGFILNMTIIGNMLGRLVGSFLSSIVGAGFRRAQNWFAVVLIQVMATI